MRSRGPEAGWKAQTYIRRTAPELCNQYTQTGHRGWEALNYLRRIPLSSAIIMRSQGPAAGKPHPSHIGHPLKHYHNYAEIGPNGWNAPI
jgi:hypothetical protein